MTLLQDPFEFGNTVSTGPLEWDQVRDPNDLHCLGIAGDLTVGHWDHVVQAQGLSWSRRISKEFKDCTSTNHNNININIHYVI